MTSVRPSTPAILAAAFWLCILVVFVALRLNVSSVELNVDELIPIKVSEAMSARGALDPNWRFGDLPWFWNTDQYNFYFYNIVAHVALKAGTWFGLAPLPTLRLANVVFQLGALAFAVDALRRLGVGRIGLAIGGALIAVAPGMVQDAGMARPESLVYLVVAAQLWLLTLPLPVIARALLFGLLLGAGSAIKATFASTAILIGVGWLVAWRPGSARAAAAAVAALCVGSVAGFVAGAPYAIIHPDVFIAGMRMLSEQYNGGQPPHSLPQYSMLGEASWIGAYFLQLYGLVVPFALAAIVLRRGLAQQIALGAAMLFLILFAFFAGKLVFYERNFAHAILPVLFAAALAVDALPRYWRLIAAVVLITPMAYWSIQIAAAVHGRDRVGKFEAANGLAPTERIDFESSFDRPLPGPCKLIAVTDHNEAWTKAYLAKLEGAGFRPVARYRGRFSLLVTSTLHTYLDTDVHYLRCPQ